MSPFSTGGECSPFVAGFPPSGDSAGGSHSPFPSGDSAEGSPFSSRESPFSLGPSLFDRYAIDALEAISFTGRKESDSAGDKDIASSSGPQKPPSTRMQSNVGNVAQLRGGKKKGKGRKTPKYLLRRKEEAMKEQEEEIAKETEILRAARDMSAEEKRPELKMGQLQSILLHLRSYKRGSGLNEAFKRAFDEEAVLRAFNEDDGREYTAEDMLVTLREAVDIAAEESVSFPRIVGSCLLSFCIRHGNEAEHGDLMTALLSVVDLESISMSAEDLKQHLRVKRTPSKVALTLFFSDPVPVFSFERSLPCTMLPYRGSPLDDALRCESRIWAFKRIVERVGAKTLAMANLRTGTTEEHESYRHGPLLFAAAHYGTIGAVLAEAPGMLFHTLEESAYMLSSLASPGDIVLMWKSAIATHERVLALDLDAHEPTRREELRAGMTDLACKVLLRILDFVATLASNKLSQGPHHRVSFTAEAAFARGDPFASLQEILLLFPEWLDTRLQEDPLAQRILLTAARAGREEIATLLLSLEAFSSMFLKEEMRLILLNAAFEGGCLQLAKEVLKKGSPLDLIRGNTEGGFALFEALKVDGQWVADVLTGRSEEFPLSEKDLEEVRAAKVIFWRAIYRFVWSTEHAREGSHIGLEMLMANIGLDRDVQKCSMLDTMRLVFDILADLSLTEFDSAFITCLLMSQPSLDVVDVLAEKMDRQYFLSDVKVAGSLQPKKMFSYICMSRLDFALGLSDRVPEMLEGLTRATWDAFLTSNADAADMLRLLPHVPVEELLKRDALGRTALHDAVMRCKHLEVIEEMRMMLPASAVSIVDDASLTPLDLVSRRSPKLDLVAVEAKRLHDMLAPASMAKRAN